MHLKASITTTALWLALTKPTIAIPSAAPNYPPNATIHLPSWPPSAAAALTTMIQRNANQSAYAVFDMDNTSYQNDLEESLLPHLENRGVLTRATLDPSLKLIPFKDTANYTESLYSYYLRLCEVDDFVCYPWAAQVWSGLTLRALKGYVDELMALNASVPVTYWDGDAVVADAIAPPRVFRGMAELYNALMAHGITVYVVSAAHEELVRMVASDPKYGYNVPPANVIGVTTMLRNTSSGALTNARKQIAAGAYDPAANMDLVVDSYLWTPATWFAGKWAAVLTYIDMWKRPVLAAGDTPGSDTYMHFNVDTMKGGVHLWVNRKEKYYEELQELIGENVEGQRENGFPVTADKNWVVVRPEEIL